MDYKSALGLIAAILSIVGHVPYLIDTWNRKTRPHIYTWLIWSILTGIAFGAQIQGGGGPGAWTTGITAILCFLIFLLALDRGARHLRKTDALYLAGSVIALYLWTQAHHPVTSIILVTAIDVLAIIPTLRKTYYFPREETLFTYQLNVLRHAIAMLALSQINILTVVYPFTVWCMNIVMTLLIVTERHRRHLLPGHVKKRNTKKKR